MTDDDVRTFVWGVILGCLVAVAALAAVGCKKVEAERPASVGIGHPLDAVQFKAPTWATGYSSWLVRDRQTKQEWWLVEMRVGNVSKLETQWVVLPRGDWDVNE